MQLGELVQPLIKAMHTDCLAQPYLCTDATGVLVQHPGRCKSGHFWVLVAPKRHALFQFSMKHDAAAVDRLLPGYTGYVVADAHSVYDHLYGDGKATEAGCWSHMRKYVLEAEIEPERLRQPMACIQALFRIERDLDRAPPLARSRIRQEKSRPIVESFFAWCEHEREQALEGSPLYAAIRYATNQRRALERFLEEPRLPIHNNISELHLRRGGAEELLVRRHRRGRPRQYSVRIVLASCTMHRIEPWAYLRDLLCLLPAWPAHRALELAPVSWGTTSARDDVRTKLEANVYRRATLIEG
ncbi:MAG TPA: transposase [Terriglobales bacterium]|nr:transposase [Terriglobales bacterium]